MSINQEIPTNTNEKALFELYPSVTVDQWRFIAARLKHSTDKAAAEEIGIHPTSVSKWSNKAEIDELLKMFAANSADGARAALEKQALEAALVLLALMGSDDERTRLEAAKQVLDRVLGKAMQRNEVSGPDGRELRIEYVNDWRAVSDRL